MDAFFTGFLLSVSVLAGLSYFKPSNPKIVASVQFKGFQKSFLFVFFIMMAADWMQGPYVYRLYAHYGFSMAENGQLFIAGFGSSLVFGTIAGSMADKYGRKLLCIMYGVTYMLSCVTKHFNNFNILMVGRLLGGISTSILFSAFESWMVSEHQNLSFPGEWLSETFSLMTVGNGITAIVAGWIAQSAVAYFDHPVAPFDVSFIFLALGTLLIATSWRENYGDVKTPTASAIQEAIKRIFSTRKILFLGVAQSLFEGAMYTFVFMWTPTLEAGGAEIPHGIAFASFMVCCSIGGTLFELLSQRMPVEELMRNVFIAAAAAMSIPALFPTNTTACLGAFLLFEVAVGVFWPGMGTLRSKYVPEEMRATMINLFRVPLNILVCLILLYVGSLSIAQVFLICVIFFLVCAGLQHAVNISSDPTPDLTGSSSEA
jgi:MFS family permease